MANPDYIIFDYPDKVAGSSGFTIYALLRVDSTDYIYDVDGDALEAVGTWNDARAGECDIPLIWKNAGHYKATFPSIAIGDYTIQLRLQAGGSPAITDAILGSQHIDSALREKLLQLYRRFFGKSTLTRTQLKCYETDGVTVSSTQAVSDDGTTQTQGEAS